ncbi:cytochrome c biogenesis protein ResB [Nonomuraea spiralis]|uniref:Cytochrome c biogenesis protein ResB n=1 Tax=Nonomuraea spiralis TaxID=46182 RepID=A0ABV5ITI1_9ACTN|nr:cytochrome c biogenesis protein ResB [Nonomuraea spiralis]GGT45914.1 cytochrome c biosynthesis protein [Nonomuraea spiralis]
MNASLRWTWRTLTSMRTALVLLFLFALASVPGSLIPQRGVSDATVAQHYADNPGLAPWLDRLWLYDVFRAPWFAAIYLLLFVSLIGCVVPRTWQHVRELRRRPPAPPRRLSGLPHHATLGTTPAEEPSEEPAEEPSEGPSEGPDTAAVAALLRRKRFRVVTGDGWVAAEKGYLRESGNLLFHVSLLGLLVSFGLGGQYGYRGNILLVEGNGFANTVSAFDRFLPGPWVGAESLEPFTLTLGQFQATYIAQGGRRGQPVDFQAAMTVSDVPGEPDRSVTLKVNEPVEVDGTQTYLLGNGYAPIFRVTDGTGQVAFDGPVPCLVEQVSTLTSGCVVKVPDARPTQLGILARFLPTAVEQGGRLTSTVPGLADPVVQVYGAFTGDLGLGDGVPQSVYQLEAGLLRPLPLGPPRSLRVGDTMDLPGAAGTIRLTGIKKWITLQVSYDPFRVPALVFAATATLGITLAVSVRRRRVWVRGAEVGGLARTNRTAFTAEFHDLVQELATAEASRRSSST